jgi:DNA-binding CsgD family transcriptional regulator
MSKDTIVELTAREQQVLGLLDEGRANKEIAEELGCTVRTVEFHISNLLRKVGVSSRLELVARGQSRLTLAARVTEEGPFVEVRLFSGVACAALGDTLVVLWSTPATPQRWSWQWARVEELMQKHPAGVVCLSLVLSSSSPPDSALRTQMKADIAATGARLRRFVVVPLGDSVWSAIVRTIGGAVLLLSGQSEQQKVAASVDQGLSLVLQAAGPYTPPRCDLERTLGELSSLLGVPTIAAASSRAS